MVPDCLYLSGSVAAMVLSAGRFRFSGAGADSSTAPEDPAAPEVAALEPADVAACDVLSEPGAVVLPPHALASSRTPRAAIVYRARRADEVVVNSKVSPGGLVAGGHAGLGDCTEYCHANDDGHVSQAHRFTRSRSQRGERIELPLARWAQRTIWFTVTHSQSKVAEQVPIRWQPIDFFQLHGSQPAGDVVLGRYRTGTRQLDPVRRIVLSP